MEKLTIEPIARIHTDFPTKFGIPRQSGIIKFLYGRIVFEPKFRDINAIRGLEEYSHIWLIWEFSENIRDSWKPTVRPPRLGGNKHIGVFATRSPFRPNPIGLSCVKFEKIELSTNLGAVIVVSEIDLMDNTPVLDIKPYIPYADSRPDALGSFSDTVKNYTVKVNFPEILRSKLPKTTCETLIEILKNDPRPSYHNSESRIYGFKFSGYNIRFTKQDDTLSVCEIVKLGKKSPIE